MKSYWPFVRRVFETGIPLKAAALQDFMVFRSLDAEAEMSVVGGFLNEDIFVLHFRVC